MTTIDEIIKVNEQDYILATSSHVDDRTRILKHGDTFAVFDRYGDIQTIVGHGEQGIFHQDTRYLSRLELLLDKNHRPLLLNSTILEDNSLMTADLTNPDLYVNGKLIAPEGTIHIFRSKLLWQGVCFDVSLDPQGEQNYYLTIYCNSSDKKDNDEAGKVSNKPRVAPVKPVTLTIPCPLIQPLSLYSAPGTRPLTGCSHLESFSAACSILTDLDSW